MLLSTTSASSNLGWFELVLGGDSMIDDPEIFHSGQGEHKMIIFLAMSLSSLSCFAPGGGARVACVGADELLRISLRVSACNLETDN